MPLDASALGVKTLRVGTYRFRSTREYPKGAGPAPTVFRGPVPFVAAGKRAQVNSAAITRRSKDRDTDLVTLTTEVRILQNPIPVLVLFAGAAAALGFAGWGVAESLEGVNRVFNNPLVWAVVILGAAWWLGLLPKGARR